MKLALFQELLDLNLAFEQVMRGLLRLERVRAFNTEQIRGARAEVETARVDVNREFFDSFDEMVEDDASWAYKFQREYKQKTKDLDDIYFDIKDSEERRKKKGLPPRLVILPGLDVSDEERYDKEQAKKKRAARKKARATKQRKSSPSGIKSGRRLSLLRRPKERPANEKEKSSGEADDEGFTQAWEAVSRRPRQDCGLGRARV